MMTVAIKKYQTSKVGNGTVNVKGKKIITSKTDVIPLTIKGSYLILL